MLVSFLIRVSSVPLRLNSESSEQLNANDLITSMNFWETFTITQKMYRERAGEIIYFES